MLYLDGYVTFENGSRNTITKCHIGAECMVEFMSPSVSLKERAILFASDDKGGCIFKFLDREGGLVISDDMLNSEVWLNVRQIKPLTDIQRFCIKS